MPPAAKGARPLWKPSYGVPLWRVHGSITFLGTPVGRAQIFMPEAPWIGRKALEKRVEPPQHTEYPKWGFQRGSPRRRGRCPPLAAGGNISLNPFKIYPISLVVRNSTWG